jgi:type IV secretory pathway VirB10-like protein
MVVVSMVDLSTFRHVNNSSMSPPAHIARNAGISRFKTLRKHSRILRGLLSTFISHIRVIILMNTKMILAAIALSLSLAACAKKEEAAAPAEPPAATDAAPAPDAAATGDAAGQAGDAAATAPSETPPADQPPAEPKQQ